MARKKSRAASGRSSVTYDERRGKWRGFVSFGTDPVTGNRDRRTVTANSERECWDKVADLERDRRRGVARRTTARLTVEQWVETWLEQCELSLKPKTADTYASLMRTHVIPRLGDTALEALTPEDVERMLAWIVSPRGGNLSPTTAGNVRRTLRVCLNSAIKRGKLVGQNPAGVARAPRVPHQEVEPLSVEEVKTILAAASKDHGAARWTIGLALGLRQGEVLALQMRDVDLDNRTILVSKSLRRGRWRHGCRNPERCAARHCSPEGCPPGCRRHGGRCPAPCRPGCKGHAHLCPARIGGGLVRDSTKTARSRVVPIPGQLAAALAEHIAATRRELYVQGIKMTEETPLFGEVDGRWTDPRTDWGRWKRLLAKAGVEHTRLHNARHTAASIMLMEGISPRVVMDILGWSQISLTVRYQHVVPELRREAAARVGEAIWGTPPPPSTGEQLA